MAQLILLIIVYGLLLILCLSSSYRNALMTPQFAYVVGFFIQAVYAVNYVETWDLRLSSSTFFVLAGGAILFVTASLLTQRMRRFKFVLGKRANRINSSHNVNESIPKQNIYNSESKVESWKLLAFLTFQVATILILIMYLRSFGGGSLSSLIYSFRYTTTFTDEEVDIPTILSQMRTLCMASGYVWGYVLMHNIICKGKSNKLLLIINIVFSGIIGIMFGSRTPLITLVISIAAQYLILREKLINRKRKLPMKFILIGLCASTVAVFTFQALGNVLGRNSTRSFSDYLAMYLSAEIKNLDIFIRTGNFGTDITNNQTFATAINWLSGKIFPSSWAHTTDISFHYINGFSLGNVSTAYYYYVYDAGYIGVIVLTIVMAFIGQRLYMQAIRPENKNGLINMSVLIYSYLYFSFLFSFFANKFYADFFSPRFLYFLVWWLLLKAFIEKVHFTSHRQIDVLNSGE